MRFNMGMTPLGAQVLFPFLVTLAVVGIIYGALVALGQTDIKRLVAYSSVSHMGFVVLGMFAMNATGMDGSVIQMVNHGLTTGALFACVGVLYERYHTREMAELSGIWKRLPLLAFFLMLSSLGSAAVPGLNGFVGEFPILTGMFARSPRAAVLGATGMILGAYYLLWMLQCVIFGPLREPHAHGHGHASNHGSESIRPVSWHEIAGLTPVMVLIVVIGVYPRPFFDRLRPSVAVIAARFQGLNEPEAATGVVRAGSVLRRIRAELPLTPVPACCDPEPGLSRSRYRKALATVAPSGPVAGTALAPGSDAAGHIH
jgi:NADH-quinone oxidoreductase subunit M